MNPPSAARKSEARSPLAWPEKPVPAHGPRLVTNAPAQRSPRSLLALWHLLSLDAPTVAALWTIFIARSAQINLPWAAPIAMFLAVWMLYAADRLLDARPQPDGSQPADLEERHLFHQRHRTAFLTTIVFASIALASLLHRLSPPALHLYAVLGVLLAAWLLLIHARPVPGTHRLPKELAVGIFFPAAVFIPTVARAPGLRLALLPSALLLAAICTLNCLFLYAWEHPGPRFTAHWTTQWATGHLPQLCSATIVLSLLTVVREADSSLTATLPAFACALSGALLLLLHRRRYRLNPVHLRALADFVLLTPLLLLPILLVLAAAQ